MQDILDQILLTDNPADAYLIGVKSAKGSTFKHELCHALYHTNREYKIIADELTNSIPRRVYGIIVNNLLILGYDTSVINDEIQAYMMTNNKLNIWKGVDIDELTEIHNKYKEQLNKFLK